jgi:hypothetical protein
MSAIVIGLNKILFPISEELRDLFDSPLDASLFEGDALALEIEPRNYRRTSSDTYKVHRGFAGSEIEIDRSPHAFEAVCEYGNESIGFILQELIDAATGDPAYYELVECRDYLVRDSADDPYTVRRGILRYEPIAGSGTGLRGRVTTGYRILFQEV